ncbi:MAG: LL-diaminopimelate aminotransferase [Phycisphaerales bacterium]|nr:LL-diaminopimelate aminotransferase [Phycisphaerales bacterium]
MASLNDHYLKLAGAYLFPEIDRRVGAFLERHPEAATRLIRCGIGDVTEPLPRSVIAAMHAALDEMGERSTFRGYGPPLGYSFLREAIAAGDFADHGLDISPEEIFVSDGSKSDCGAILDILGDGNRFGVPDPVYPVYVDTNVMAGNTGPRRDDGRYEGLAYLPCTADNGFVPEVPDTPLDVIYLCFPNNPTGGMITRPQLRAWVDYALRHDAIILYDVAYQAYVRDADAPRSIYEIDGARRCAMEFHSFSKSGGFTGVRCGYTVCPRELQARTRDGEPRPLHGLWARRWSTKSNSVGYVVQRGAEALFGADGRREVATLVEHYLGNATLLREGCAKRGMDVFGGTNAPYVWVRCPDGRSSWETFDWMLEEAGVIITPGVGFGQCGEGYFRISAFNTRDNVEQVVDRLGALEQLTR